MTNDSKIFVGLKPIRKKAAPSPDVTGPRCQWDGCSKTGTHRAPVGRDAEGLYLLFCLEHVKLYNAGYSATGQSESQTARYQKEAASGARATQGQVAREAEEIPLPSTQRSGSAKSLNARRSAAQRQAQKVELQKRKLKVLEARAFETLGLAEDASADEIRRRYKEKLKMHHPDANKGERDTEGQLQASIEAYRILKMNGFC
ncbi:J domain-containing protein [Rhizobium panacihumi]|uniref:J domain-containing protein n=1 Tax=Rhizobium panacihumi TaxID=2008450 RepID=UPI003D7B6656